MQPPLDSIPCRQNLRSILRKGCLSLVFLGLAACSSERTETALWNLHVLADACPSPAEAKDELIAIWGQGSTRIDGMSCTLEEVLEVDADSSTPDQPSCCYPIVCDSPLRLDQLAIAYSASCMSLACSNIDLTRFSSENVALALAERLPLCALDPATLGASDESALQCWYSVTARYSCSNAPG